jgi:hypothetical protein
VRWPTYLFALAVAQVLAFGGASFAPADEPGDSMPDTTILQGPMEEVTVEELIPEPDGWYPGADDCTSCDPELGPCMTPFPLGPQWFAYGWLQQGFTANTDSPFDRFNGPMGFNDRSNEYQLNQFYLRAGRRVNRDGCCWDVGAQVDVFYGTDYFFTQARGLETNVDGSPKWNSADGPRATPTSFAAMYGLAMPQVFAELYLPVGCGMSFKFGHFYTTLGYESVPAPENFFYSHAYTMVYGEPKTHTGVLSSYDLTECFQITAGLTNGWDNFSDDNGRLGFLGGVSWKANDGSSSFAFQIHTGAEDPNGENSRTVYSLIYTEELIGGLTYVFQHDFGVEQNAALNGNRLANARWYGINQYLFCPVNCCTELGLRAEWFRDEHNARILGIPTDASEGGNYVALTAGVNWRPTPRLLVRPELRWDSSDASASALGVGGMFDAFRKQDQITLAVDLIAFF